MRMRSLLRAATSAVLVLASLASAQTGVWTDVQPSASPPVRATEGLAFEPVSGLVIAYGGTPDETGYSPFDESWAFDGCTWTQLFPAGNPGTRFNAYLAQSPSPGRVVLFGGGVVVIPTPPVGYVPIIDGSTWEFDTQSIAWTNVTPAGPSPSPRQLANTVYDSSRGRTVLFGGTNGYGTAFYADTWEWDGTAWANVTPVGGPSPVARAWHSMAYDSARQRTVLFGGYNGSQLGDTWEWDGTQWIQILPSTSPAPRSSGAIAYDPWTERVVLFAGSFGWPIGLNDTWEYDGTNWYPVGTVGPVPPPQYLHRMVGDPVRGGILVYGAFGNGWSPLNDTWRYHRASLVANPPDPPAGTTVSYQLSLPGDAGLPYVAGVSLSGTCPGIPLPDGRIVSLNHDGFTDASASGAYPAAFQGFVGSLDGVGTALLGLPIPAVPGLGGLTIDVAAVTLNGGAIGSVTNTATVVVQ
ncbi:MAG: kelch repeat-containing protein [Planctomycetes bacterium]|nr:kelch repeat-containing protein [Planctomycetota bacterium]